MISAFTTGAPQEGIEPTAFRVEAGRSLRLSYWGVRANQRHRPELNWTDGFCRPAGSPEPRCRGGPPRDRTPPGGVWSSTWSQTVTHPVAQGVVAGEGQMGARAPPMQSPRGAPHIYICKPCPGIEPEVSCLPCRRPHQMDLQGISTGRGSSARAPGRAAPRRCAAEGSNL